MKIATFHQLLASTRRPWRIEPVPDFPGAYVLSNRGPARFDALLDLADDQGQPDLAELDDILCVREPWRGLAGFVVKDDEPEAEAELVAWAAAKLGLGLPQ